VPWVQDFQVEQDLVISRALLEIFSKPDLSAALAFRGGTALHKLHIKPPARYSEDIGLVQVQAGAIGQRSRRCGAFSIPEGADLAGEDSPFVAYG
jgi:predicted nucleotidyltransferase component of viral defense system